VYLFFLGCVCVFSCGILLHHGIGCFITNIDWNKSRFQLANFGVCISALTGNPRPAKQQGMFLFLVSLQSNQKITCGQEKTMRQAILLRTRALPFWDDEQYKNVTEIQRLSR